MLARSNFLSPRTNFVVALFGLETMLTSATQTMQELSDKCVTKLKTIKLPILILMQNNFS